MSSDILYPDIPQHLAGAVLTIDLDAVTANYMTLKQHLGDVECAAVVKADAYGLSSEKVGPALADAGCNVFFVAHVNEAIRLRRVLPECEVHVLHGVTPGSEDTFIEFNLIPMLGSLEDIERWRQYCGEQPRPCDIHLDTGMLRLGLPPGEQKVLCDDLSLIEGMDIRLIASHLASADDPKATQNIDQLSAFQKLRGAIPAGRASFCNSSGIFLGSDYHFDLARPGVALYGINPTPSKPNPMKSVVSLRARIVQVRDASASDTVGYSATHILTKPARVATIAIGYADGIPRSLSNNSCVYIGNHRIPIIGCVSMDLITLEVSDVPKHLAAPGQWVELIGPHHTVDDMADDAGTIGYEILTSLGRRYHRVYKGVKIY